MSNLFTNYLKESYVPAAVQNIVQNSFWFQQPFFEVVQPGACPSGPHINSVIEYGVSSSAEVYVQGAPMPTPGTLSDVRAYFTKDFFQDSAKVYGDTQSMLRNGGVVDIDPVKRSIDQSIQNVVTIMQSTFLTDLAAQVDSTTNYSDSGLVRATYNLASYEEGSIGDLAKDDLTAMIEAMIDLNVSEQDMVFLLPSNQHTHLANLLGTAYNEISVDGSSMAAADLGTKFRCMTFNGIPILQVPGMTNTESYLVRASKTKIFLHEPITVVPKESAEWADQWLTTGGANLVCLDPRRAAKITGLTA